MHVEVINQMHASVAWDMVADLECLKVDSILCATSLLAVFLMRTRLEALRQPSW